MNNGDGMENVYDGMGVRVKEITTSGGSTTEKRFVNALGRVIQERDATDAVTARYYWEGSRFLVAAWVLIASGGKEATEIR